MKSRPFYFLILITLAFSWSFTSCTDRKIEITSEYIINENWTKSANAIEVEKMKLKKDSVIDLSNLNQIDILNKLEEDSSFNYFANVKLNTSSNKIYFNKEYGFYWWTDKGNSKTKILGDLQKGNWYKFSHLVTNCQYIYVFIDSLNKAHIQDVNLCNY